MAGKDGKANRSSRSLECRPGVVFKPSRNRLYVFEARRIFVISGGPRPQAWRKTVRKGWQAARPPVPRHVVRTSLRSDDGGPSWETLDGLPVRGFQYLFPFMETLSDAWYGDQAWIAWLRGLDVEARRAVEPFNERTWHLLMLALRCPGAIDLIRSCPALAFALASSWVFRGERRVQRPLRAARSLVRKRQREIAGWLGFPETESGVRILRRVPTQEVAIGPLLYLRDAMADEQVVRVLRHVPRVSAEVIRMASTPALWRHASPRLLMEVGSNPHREYVPVWRMMRDAVEMLRQLGRPWESLVFRSREHVEAVHDEAVEMLNRAGWRRHDVQWAIPAPPVEGTNTIVPLDCLESFIEEGRQQHNCVASYAARVVESAAWARNGQPSIYLYRVLWPQRATLSIVRRGGQWVIDELRCASNRQPSKATMQFVQGWLDCHRGEPPAADEADAWCGNDPALPAAWEEEAVPF